MLSYIKGELSEIQEASIVIENNGLGYNINTPLTVIENMPPIGDNVKIYTYLYVREDAINLYGFLNREDLRIFKMLINVNGIGPKAALGLLSAISADDLRFAILSEDVNTIKSAPGIGAKTAQRIIIELKDKLNLSDVFEEAVSKNEIADMNSDIINARNDAVAALVALGYSNKDAVNAVRRVENIADKTTEQVLKEALRNLL